METKREFTNRCQSEGLWQTVLERRETLKNDGHSAKEAWEIVMREFPPVGGMEPSGGRRKSRPAAVVEGGAAVQEPKPGGDPKDCPRVSLSEFLTWQGFRQATTREDIAFVFNFMDVDEAAPSMAPSPGAWSLLMRCRKNPALTLEFFRSIWPKILPKAQVDDGDRFSDDGRVLGLIEDVARASERAAANNPMDTCEIDGIEGWLSGEFGQDAPLGEGAADASGVHY